MLQYVDGTKMKERFWDRYQSWTDAEAAWDAMAAQASAEVCLKTPACLPSIPPIAPGEAMIRWKAIRWVMRKDGGYRLFRFVFRHPFHYLWKYICSVAHGKPYRTDGDLFFYGVKTMEQMSSLMQRDDVILIVGISYCEKPFECPCGRFSDGCTSQMDNPVCQQCFVGKVMHTLPSCKTIPIIIPTINDIGTHVLEVLEAFPNHQVLFLITACEMALQMFGDFGNMVGIKGVGIRLGGRICNTMRAFALSEEGVKPGLTAVLPSTQRRMLDLLRYWREARTQEGYACQRCQESGNPIRS